MKAPTKLNIFICSNLGQPHWTAPSRGGTTGEEVRIGSDDNNRSLLHRRNMACVCSCSAQLLSADHIARCGIDVRDGLGIAALCTFRTSTQGVSVLELCESVRHGQRARPIVVVGMLFDLYLVISNTQIVHGPDAARWE